LWKTYLDRVEVCAGLKILHIPSHEVKVYSVINDPTKASFEDLALCFAIYFAATTSLDSLEASIIFGHDRDRLLHSFKLGLEQAFAYGDFLDRPKLTGVYALAMHLVHLNLLLGMRVEH
jgi:hypothetical protein